MLETLFWTAVAALTWHYVGYPLLMWARAAPRLADFKESPQLPAPAPSVSVILPVRNEVDRIRPRIDNLWRQTYPGELEVIVVANGCTDGTVEAARTFAGSHSNIRVFESPPEEGKAGALNRGVAESGGDVLVFADARQDFESSAITHLVAALGREDVGVASGALSLDSSDAPAALRGVGTYWQAERWLRFCEGVTGSTVGATGAIYAIRRELFSPLPPGLVLDDVWVPMKAVLAGNRNVVVPSAVAVDETGSDAGLEFRRKVRTLAGNYQLLRFMPELLWPHRNPIFFRFFSHRILRLGSPFFSLALLLGFLLPGTLPRFAAGGALALGALGSLGLIIPVRILAAPAAFLLANAAALAAVFVQHRRTEVLWASGREPN